MPEKVNLDEKFGLFSAPWTPKVIGEVDDYEIKIVRIAGEFVWHAHDDVDEVFVVLDGEMIIQFRDGDVSLGSGELLVVPKGVEHRPVSASECRAMIFEKKGTVNTGDTESDLTVAAPERL